MDCAWFMTSPGSIMTPTIRHDSNLLRKRDLSFRYWIRLGRTANKKYVDCLSSGFHDKLRIVLVRN